MSEEKPKEPIEQPTNQEPTQQNQTDKLQAEKDEIFSRLQRVSAEFANYQKRSVKQVAETIVYEKEIIIKSMLPVLDNFEHTLSHIENAQQNAELIKGIKIIYDQFVAALKSHGVEQINAVGETFDPSYHQALTQRTEPDKQDKIVLEEFRKGYKMGDKVIRPATVIVNKNIPSEQPCEEEQQMDKPDSETGA